MASGFIYDIRFARRRARRRCASTSTAASAAARSPPRSPRAPPMREALFAAADIAVEQTNGLGPARILHVEARLHRQAHGPRRDLHLRPLLRRREADHPRPRDRDDAPLVAGRREDHLHELLPVRVSRHLHDRPGQLPADDVRQLEGHEQRRPLQPRRPPGGDGALRRGRARDLRQQCAGPRDRAADPLRHDQGVALLVARRLAHHLRDGARTPALHDAGLGRHPAAGELRRRAATARSPTGAGRPRTRSPSRMDGGRELPDRRPRPFEAHGRAGLQGASSTASNLPGCRTGGTWSTRRATRTTAGSRILDTETGKSTRRQPVELRARPSRRASGRAEIRTPRRSSPRRRPSWPRSTRPST